MKRLLRNVALALLGVALLALTWLHLRDTTLPGVRVAGQALERTEHVHVALQRLATDYLSTPVTLSAGPIQTTASRQDLGAAREVDVLAERIDALGRDANPLASLMALARAWSDGWDFAWPVSVDRGRVAEVIRKVAREVERPPLAGTVGEGWAMEGVPGISLNLFDALAQIEDGLKNGALEIALVLREVPAPEPLALGAPDGVFGSAEELQHDSDEAYADPQVLATFQPQQWLPSRGSECDLSGAYARFCQGPRRVAAPFGDDAQRAEALGLGTFQAVSHLISHPPRDAWIDAAGGPAVDATLLHPVKGGVLWRGFGFVRAGELKDVLHKGIDVGAARGTPMRAVNDGIVAYADNGVRGYGNLLVLIHGSGSVTSYAHCAAIYVFPGQRVVRGQIVGEVGDTGIARGVHLHFEYRQHGQPTDPMERIVDPTD